MKRTYVSAVISSVYGFGACTVHSLLYAYISASLYKTTSQRIQLKLVNVDDKDYDTSIELLDNFLFLGFSLIEYIAEDESLLTKNLIFPLEFSVFSFQFSFEQLKLIQISARERN